MKKSIFSFGGFFAIAVFFLTTTSCGGKSDNLDEGTTLPVSQAGEFIHQKISGYDTIYTGSILSWSLDSKTNEVSARFDGNGDRTGALVKGTIDDVYGLLSEATDSVGIKYVKGANPSSSYWKIQEFYSGPKYVDGQTAYFNPDILDISFDENGRIVNASVTSFVGDCKSVNIDPVLAPDVIKDILNASSPALIGVKYQNDGWEFMSITVPVQ